MKKKVVGDAMYVNPKRIKIYYYPLKDNQQAGKGNDSGGEVPYRRVDALAWDNHKWSQCKAIT